MAVNRITISLVNTNESVSNNALVSFVLTGSVPYQQQAALCAAYLSAAGGHCMAQSTSIRGINVRAAGSAGGLAIPFPRDAYDILQPELVAAGVPAVADLDYGDEIGFIGGFLAPVGTSVCVSERTATLGRTGIGRHFLPFTTSASVTSGGELASSTITNLTDDYEGTFLNSDITGYPYGPAVAPSNLSTTHLITAVIPQPVLSNLRSRRR